MQLYSGSEVEITGKRTRTHPLIIRAKLTARSFVLIFLLLFGFVRLHAEVHQQGTQHGHVLLIPHHRSTLRCLYGSVMFVGSVLRAVASSVRAALLTFMNMIISIMFSIP